MCSGTAVWGYDESDYDASPDPVEDPDQRDMTGETGCCNIGAYPGECIANVSQTTCFDTYDGNFWKEDGTCTPGDTVTCFRTGERDYTTTTTGSTTTSTTSTTSTSTSTSTSTTSTTTEAVPTGYTVTFKIGTDPEALTTVFNNAAMSQYPYDERDWWILGSYGGGAFAFWWYPDDGYGGSSYLTGCVAALGGSPAITCISYSLACSECTFGSGTWSCGVTYDDECPCASGYYYEFIITATYG